MTLLKTNGNVVKPYFDSFFDEFFNTTGSAHEPRWSTVPVNIHETKDAYHIELSVPGVKKEDIKTDVEHNILTISYEIKEETKKEDYKTIRREFRQQNFKRSFTLSDKVQVDAIEGKYEDGVLKIHVPKKPEAQLVSKQITIK